MPGTVLIVLYALSYLSFIITLWERFLFRFIEQKKSHGIYRREMASVSSYPKRQGWRQDLDPGLVWLQDLCTYPCLRRLNMEHFGKPPAESNSTMEFSPWLSRAAECQDGEATMCLKWKVGDMLGEHVGDSWTVWKLHSLLSEST